MTKSRRRCRLAGGECLARGDVVVTRLAVAVERAEREDLLQDTLARAWTKRAAFDPARGALGSWQLAAGSWLMAIMLDQACGRWRVRRSKFVLIEPDGASGRLTNRLDVRSAVDRLPRQQRAAVVLFDYADFPVIEIAQLLSCSTGTVKSALFDARKRLATELVNYA